MLANGLLMLLGRPPGSPGVRESVLTVRAAPLRAPHTPDARLGEAEPRVRRGVSSLVVARIACATPYAAGSACGTGGPH